MVRRHMGALDLGWKVLVWPEQTKWEYVGSKDINDMILRGQTTNEVLKIINKNTYSGQRGEWEVRMWSKALW